MVELIYHEYCLAETAGLDPDPDEYLRRFPAVREPLARLLHLHETIDASQLLGWSEPADLPEVGDEIGPYRLVRELGRGGFARVFLAEQADLDDRLVVVKVSRQVTPEPRLLARARHPHIVEVLWHGLAEGGALQLICMPFLGGATLAALLAVRPRRGARPRSGRDLLAALDRVAAPEYPRSGRRPPRPRDRRAAVLSPGDGLGRRPAGRGARPRLRPGRGARRRQAVERPADGRRRPDAARLQPRRRLAVSRRGGRVERPGGDARLHGPRAAPERRRPVAGRAAQAGRPPPRRPVFARHGPARSPGRAPPGLPDQGPRPLAGGAGRRLCPVPRPRGRGDDPGRADPDPAGAAVDPGAVPGPRPGRPLQEGRRARRGPRPLADRPRAGLRQGAGLAARPGPLGPPPPPGAGRRRAGAGRRRLGRAGGRPRIPGGPADAVPGQVGPRLGPPRGGDRPVLQGSATGNPTRRPTRRWSRCGAWSSTASPAPATGGAETTSATCRGPIARSWRPGSWSKSSGTPVPWPSAPIRRRTGGAGWPSWSGPWPRPPSRHCVPRRTSWPGAWACPIPAPGPMGATGPPPRPVGWRITCSASRPSRPAPATRWPIIGPSCARAPVLLGPLRLRRGLRPPPQLRHRRRTLPIVPRPAARQRPLHNLLAGCLFQMGRYDEALAECDHSLALDPDQADGYRTRAYIRNHLKQRESVDLRGGRQPVRGPDAIPGAGPRAEAPP